MYPSLVLYELCLCNPSLARYLQVPLPLLRSVCNSCQLGTPRYACAALLRPCAALLLAGEQRPSIGGAGPEGRARAGKGSEAKQQCAFGGRGGQPVRRQGANGRSQRADEQAWRLAQAVRLGRDTSSGLALAWSCPMWILSHIRLLRGLGAFLDHVTQVGFSASVSRERA